MPWFPFERPSMDYYTSNLNLYNFIQCNMTENRYTVTLYDERGMGKDANAMCSLRFRYHLDLLQKARIMNRSDKFYKRLIMVCDNCVGQNKSQVVFKFFMLLSLLIYTDGVYVHFTAAGHGKQQSDRVKGTIINKSKSSHTALDDGDKAYYVPEQVVELMNECKNVEAIFFSECFSDSIHRCIT